MSLAPPGCGPPPSSASSVFIRMTPTCRMDGSCGVQNPRTPQKDVGKDFRWVSVDPAPPPLSVLYSLACLFDLPGYRLRQRNSPGHQSGNQVLLELELW